MSSIAEIQDKKEQEILEKYEKPEAIPEEEASQERRDSAARVIQKTYRGHRERRHLKGLSLDPTTRWTEAIKEAQYRSLTTPRSRTAPHNNDGIKPVRRSGSAHESWTKVSKIARRATMDEDSSLSSSSDSEITNPVRKKSGSLTPSQKEIRRQKRLAEQQERVKSAKTMDLSYFLEMVDVKHRYGSNLRKYHVEWQSRPTHENFFYWLDHGDGKDLDLPKCSRDRLDSMQVRYLSKEERKLYEVIVAENGKLVWRKDGVRVDTTSGKWKDSVMGIVSVDSKERAWAHDRPTFATASSQSSVMGSDTEQSHPGAQEIGVAAQPNGESVQTKPPEDDKSKRRRSLHDFFRKATGGKKEEGQKGEEDTRRPKNKQMWIFVADTKNNLYIGMKQTGAFQHSSFLHGSRISAAGIIIVKDGQLQILQPRSGHYRTPSHNLHIFIKSLQARDVDMSLTAVGGSYAAMVGIETYMKTKGKLSSLKQGMKAMTIKEDEHDGENPKVDTDGTKKENVEMKHP